MVLWYSIFRHKDADPYFLLECGISPYTCMCVSGNSCSSVLCQLTNLSHIALGSPFVFVSLYPGTR